MSMGGLLPFPADNVNVEACCHSRRLDYHINTSTSYYVLFMSRALLLYDIFHELYKYVALRVCILLSIVAVLLIEY